jgi:hypothetical protein
MWFKIECVVVRRPRPAATGTDTAAASWLLLPQRQARIDPALNLHANTVELITQETGVEILVTQQQDPILAVARWKLLPTAGKEHKLPGPQECKGDYR